MDYATGIVGIKRGISYQSLAEELYVDPGQGKKNTGSVSHDQIKRALKLLEQKGLIENQSIQTAAIRKLILKCVLADRDESGQNKPAPFAPSQAALQAALAESQKNSIKTNTNEEQNNKAAPQAALAEIAKPALPPVSGINTTITITARDENFHRSSFCQQFMTLLNDRKFRPTEILHPKTGAMIATCEAAGSTIDDVVGGMYQADAKTQGRPTYATYYKPFILEFTRVRLEPIQNQTMEKSHDRQYRQQPRKQDSVSSVRDAIIKKVRSSAEKAAERSN